MQLSESEAKKREWFKELGIREAGDVWVNGFGAGIKPAPPITVSAWADKNLILPRGGTEAGKYRTARTPYVREIMDCLSLYSPVEQIKLMKGTQIGGTTIATAWKAYTVDVAPCSFQMLLPTDGAAESYSKSKWGALIEANPILKAKIHPVRSRRAGTTLTHKEFLGGFIDIDGANTNVSFRGKSIRWQVCDDVDGWPLDVDGEGDPLGLAFNRTDAFGRRRKVLTISSPTAEITSRIAKEFQDSDQRHYHVPCPFCGAKQKLEWGGKDLDYGLSWDKGAGGIHLPETAFYRCKFCKERIEERYKTEMMLAGEWIAANPAHRHRGYHLPSFYSPVGWLSWSQIVDEFLKAIEDGNRTLLKRWVTTRKAEPYREGVTVVDHGKIYARRANYGVTVPVRGQIIVAGVDTQDNRLEVLVKAYGHGRESWGLEHSILNGDPSQKTLWDALDKTLDKTYLTENGERKKISAACVDSGGHHTAAVYEYVKPREIRRVYATKGSNQKSKPLIAGPSLNNLNKVKLYFVGTDTAKELIYSALKLDTPGPGYIHYNMGFDAEFFAQLTAETVDASGRWWLPPGKKNEALDLEVLCLAALELLNPDFDSIDNLDLTQRAFYSYDPLRHLKDVCLNPLLPILVCCDFNRNPLTWLFAQTDGRQVWIFDEMSIRNCNTIRMGAEVMRRHGEHKAGYIIYGPASGAVSGGANKSDYSILRDLGFSAQRYKRVDAPIHDRVNAINRMLEDVPGTVRLTINAKCINVVKDIERSGWSQDGADFVRTEFGRGNAADALGYFINYEWPLKAHKVNQTKMFYK